jgi:hypothetical protein
MASEVRVENRGQKKIWPAFAMLIVSVCLSCGAFYYFFRPRVVEKIVEKPVDRVVQKTVQAECPKTQVPTSPAKVARSKPKPETPQVNNQAKQQGNDNTANPGTATAPVTVDNCGVAQIGGSNNTATTNCVPADRHLTDEQIETVHKIIQSIPDSVKVMVKTIDGNGEALRYAQQFQDTAVQCGKSGNPKAVILGMMWRPVPVGLWILSRSDNNPVSPYRTELTDALSSKNIQVKAGTGDWVMDEELYIVVGELPKLKDKQNTTPQSK